MMGYLSSSPLSSLCLVIVCFVVFSLAVDERQSRDSRVIAKNGQRVAAIKRKSLDSHDMSAGLKGKRVPLSDKKKVDSRVAGKTVAGVTQAQPPYSLPTTKPVPTVLQDSTCENRGSSSCTAADASQCFTASGAIGKCGKVDFLKSYLYNAATGLFCCVPTIPAADTCRSKGFTPCTKPIPPATNDPVCRTGLATGKTCKAVGNMFCCT